MVEYGGRGHLENTDSTPAPHNARVVQPVGEAQKQTEEYRETEQQTKGIGLGCKRSRPGCNLVESA